MRRVKEIKIEHDKNKPFYDLADIDYLCSFNTNYIIINSIRNLGKSYAGMMHAKRNIDRGKTILWERYNKDEFALSYGAWCNTFPDLVPVTDKGLKYLVNEETGGKAIMIQTSVANNLKGYDDVLEHLPVFEYKDEYLPIRYLQNNRLLFEFEEAMEIRQTFKRNGNMRSIYLGNNLNWINPYSIGWELTPVNTGFAKIFYDTYSVTVNGEKVSKTRSILLESPKPTQAQIKRILESKVTSSGVDVDLEGYLDNTFYKEYDKIAKCPDMTVQLSEYELMSQGYYFGFRIFEGRYYFTRIKHASGKTVFVSEKEYIDIDEKHFRRKELASLLEDAFNKGLCIFDSTNTLMAYYRWLINNRKRA